MKKRVARYLIGPVVMLATVGLILIVFLLLGRTEMGDQYLGNDAGRRYELLSDGQVRPYGPENGENGYEPLPEDTQAVRIIRVMTEEISNAQLSWIQWDYGVEVFLDGAPLHTDFPNLERDELGFVSHCAVDWERLFRGQPNAGIKTRMSLPRDYLGKELSLTTYSQENMPYEKYPQYL